MELLTLLLLFHHALAQFDSDFFDQEKCVIDYRSLENMWENKLRHDLKQCFVRRKPPPQNGTEPLMVDVQFFMKTFKFDSELQEFSTLSWIAMGWKDPRLKWDPAKYDGIDSLVMSSRSGLWVPRIRLINSIQDDYDLRYLFIPFEVHYKGVVSCTLRIDFKVKCVSDLREWPYDAQHCMMQFGTYHEPTINLQLNIGPHGMFWIANRGEWIMKDIEQIMDETSKKQVIFKFRLERHPEGLAAIVIYPALILTALTVSSLFLDARCNQRLLVICFSLICQFYLLKDVSWEFPENISDPPNLLLYCRGSFILTTFLAVEHLILNSICKKEATCFKWVKATNDFVYTKIKIIWPRWETKTEENKNNFVKDWTDFANIVNIISIFVTMIVYVCLYCVFMPQPNTFNSE